MGAPGQQDRAAVGCARAWGCSCGDGRLAADCVNHVASQHVEFLGEPYGPDATSQAAFPLFPDRRGGTVTEETVFKLVESLAELMDFSTLDDSGHRCFGGCESPGPSGSRLWASLWTRSRPSAGGSPR
ncbi:unnamed protein product [Prorocentrum cordatum]|uniref:Uncharacterized protein n=1 Tax=Prorocentrum cordatum TaxID=2364126 RepID=A0ABN9STE2_9DINO|nr:unnamed protein product [Polarella glacialis]